MTRRACLLACPLLLAACPPDEPPIRTLVPEIVVAPDTLDFGDRAVPLTFTEQVFVANDGNAPLDVSVAIAGDDAGVFALDDTEAEIGRDESATFTVRFTPGTFLDYAAELVFTSNDEERPEVRIPLTGTGVSAPMPDVELSRASIDFGTGDAARTEVLLVRNVGEAPLELGAVTQEGSGAFSLLTDPADTTIAPGDDLPVVVQYAPTGVDGDDATVTIVTNDPDEGTVQVVLLGNGGGDYDYPVAVIDCPGAPLDPPRMVPLDGGASYDPEGHTPLAYHWELLEVPTNDQGVPLSDARLTNAVGRTTELWADAVGTYVVQLVVENSLGVRSAPALCEVTAQPEEDILVELTWSTTNADLDLHVAYDGGPLFAKPLDACWCNPTPSWGQAGTADDASLDLDDKAGLGPENVSVLAPADGTYDVRVHYFDDHGDDVVTATVRVYLLGSTVPAFEASRNLERNQVWEVARIRWPDTTVATLGSDLSTTSRRQCYTP